METIGFGGSCHWCTEAIFLSLRGTAEVLQGWISPADNLQSFSEAVIVKYNAEIISLETLVAIHLHSHSCTSTHSMRAKYRSAIYVFDDQDAVYAKELLIRMQPEFEDLIITEVLRFGDFRLNKPEYLNYYFSDPSRPFCENIVNPKLSELMKNFSASVDQEKLAHLVKI
ncbi:MAG: peptide-methionine (S)-S-oxide reductase [Bacteroidota bacterium]